MPRKLSIDIETYSSYDLSEVGVYKYVESPDFAILLFAYAFDNEPAQVVDLASGEKLPDDVADALSGYDDVELCAHNAAFERVCIDKYFGHKTDIAQWHCTMVHASMLGLPLALGQVAKVLKLVDQKDARGKLLIRTYCGPRKPTKNNSSLRNLPTDEPDKWAEFIEYCRQDVVVERNIRNKIAWYEIPQTERELYCLDQKINDTGVLLDIPFIENAIRIDADYRARLEKEAVELTGLDNPNSVAQLKKWLEQETGDTIEKLTKDTVTQLLGNDNSERVDRLLTIRQEMSKTSNKKYHAMLAGVCADGRFRGLFQFYGANRTGRWAGRLVQVQNLPKNKIEGGDLDFARRLVAEGDGEGLEFFYGNVPDTLSQLIRTAFIAPTGNKLRVCDFSAGEARVIAWLAKEKWRMDVFATHGKIYEASASQMFKVPIETIAKGRENYELRSKGKIAELACGFGGGVGALEAMGALKMGLDKKDLQPLITAWRLANPNIVLFWKAMETAAITAVETGEKQSLQFGISFHVRNSVLFMTLPSGRQLGYMRPKLSPGKYGDSLSYEGMNQTTKQWQREDTYGGKLVENCLGANTLVLTKTGWVRIVDVSPTDMVWDGVEWVSHEGLIDKGEQITITLNGIHITPEHGILTTEGWKTASSSQGYYGQDCKLADCNFLRRLRRGKVGVVSSLRLRGRKANGRNGVQQRQNKVLRLSKRYSDRRSGNYARYVQSSGLCRLALNDRPLQTPDAPGLGKLRRSRNIRLRKVANRVSRILDGHGDYLQTGVIHRTQGRERKLQPGKLRMGHLAKARSKQKEQPSHRYAVGRHDCERSRRAVGYRGDNVAIQACAWGSPGAIILGTGHSQPVYDLKNTGPLHRFTVLSNTGPIIVHNCVQATQRDWLAFALLSVDKAGYSIALHVHDEVVTDVPETFGSVADLERVMTEPIPWAAGLPLKAEGFESTYYKK